MSDVKVEFCWPKDGPFKIKLVDIDTKQTMLVVKIPKGFNPALPQHVRCEMGLPTKPARDEPVGAVSAKGETSVVPFAGPVFGGLKPVSQWQPLRGVLLSIALLVVGLYVATRFGHPAN